MIDEYMPDKTEVQANTHEERTHTEVIQAAARVLVEVVTGLIQNDPHQWSSRPCPTCSAVSTILGKPFGCLTKNKIGR